MINPSEFKEVFGKTFVDRQEEPLIQLGKVTITRWGAVNQIGCGHYKAIGILRAILIELGVKSVKQLMSIAPQDLARIKGVGVTTLYAAMCVLDAQGVDVREWYRGGKTFAAIQRQERKANELHEALPKRGRRRRVPRPNPSSDLPPGQPEGDPVHPDRQAPVVRRRRA